MQSMSYVFFDLEWNQGYPRNEAEKIDEIIQIGAHRLDRWEDPGTSFSAYVRPSIHKRLHHQVRKILPLHQSQLKRAGTFREVISEFFRWCGPDPVFFTWGTCDARVLDTNLCWYGMEEYLDLEIYDLQRAFDLLVLETNRQTSLEAAVTALGLDGSLTYHDAGNDAIYTARIGAELIRRFGALPSAAELDAAQAALRLRQQQEAAEEAAHTLDLLVRDATPALRRRSGPFPGEAACLHSRSARMFPCPACGGVLCSGSWYRIGARYVSQSRCGEHGRFYSVLSVKPTSPDEIAGELLVFSEEDFPRELYHQCRLGGELVEMQKLPRKRRRRRHSGERKRA